MNKYILTTDEEIIRYWDDINECWSYYKKDATRFPNGTIKIIDEIIRVNKFKNVVIRLWEED